MTRVIALVTCLALAGCSFVLVKPLRTTEAEPAQWPICTEHYFWQAVDGAVAVIALTGLVYFLRQDDEWAPVGAVFHGGLAAGFGASAINGLGKTGGCRDARAAYEAAAERESLQNKQR